MQMTKAAGATNFTGRGGTSYSASGNVEDADVALAHRNGWVPNDLGSGVTPANDFSTSSVALANAVSLSTGAAKNVTSLALTQGVWDVTGIVDLNPAASTTVTLLEAGVSLTSNALASQAGGSGLGTDPNSSWAQPSAAPGANPINLEVGPVRLTLTAPTTVYLVAQATFATSTLSAFGTLSARKVK